MVRSVSPISGSPFWFIPIFKNIFSYISVIHKASDFKFAMQLGFDKVHHKILPEDKVGVVIG